MAGMAIDGLASGLDTTSLISQLMQVEAQPQTLLTTKVTKAQSFVSALQSLNTRVSSLAQSGTKAADARSWQAVTASSSSTSVTATTSAGAQPGALSFTVDKVASRQTSLSGAVADLAGFFGGATPTSLTLAKGTDTAGATFTTVDLTGVTTLAGLAGAINKSGTGVTATLVNVAGGSTRIQLTGKDTGAAAGFDLYAGTETSGTTATPLLGRTAAYAPDGTATNAVVSSASDAEITLWPGVQGASQTVTSATNTFKGLLTGVDFTVSQTETDATGAKKQVTVGIAQDETALKKLGSDLVANLGTVLSEIASRTKSTTSKGSDGREIVTGGVLSADSATRTLKQSLLSQVSMPVDGKSPSSIGIVLQRDGTVTFDEAAFTAALKADPAHVQSMLTTIAGRVGDVAEGVSNPTKGTLSLKISGQQTYVRSLNDQVSSWDERLSLRRTALEKTYSALEVSMSNLSAQSSWLSSQLASLTANQS